MATFEHNPVFGKNVIETLSEGMYDNPLFLFREYVQNSADAIDSAISAGILSKHEAQININIDIDKRKIVFHDNGIGIPHAKVISLLANIGDSEKDRLKNKGFRGIGRLGGLGYCKIVRFETSYIDEDVKTIMEWDAQELHKILSDKSIKIDAGEVIKRITTVTIKECDSHEHYFKVSLIDINSTSNDLLDIEDVRKYLSMVSPVPFDFERFRFVNIIENFIKENNLPELNEYNIYLNGDEIRKGYETPLIIEDSKQPIEILNVACRLLKDDNKIIGWYWFCISKFEGVIPTKCWQRCIRLRKSNIQIGEADCLSNHPKRGQALWKEDRGNNYFLGEIHVIDPNLIPNSRRDYFNQDFACRRFEIVLATEFKNLHKLYHDASTIRSATEQIKQATTERQNFNEKVKSGVFLDIKEKQKAEQKVESEEKKAEEARKRLEKIKEKVTDKTQGDIVSAQVLDSYENLIEESNDNTENTTTLSETKNVPEKTKDADKYAKVNKKTRKILHDVFSVIDKMLPEGQAEPLKEAIIKRVSHS